MEIELKEKKITKAIYSGLETQKKYFEFKTNIDVKF